MRIRRSPKSAPAFTLIEVLLSASLMAMILVSAYLCLNAAVQSRKLIEPRIEIYQNARVALALITADLRGACILSTNYQFLGMRRTLGDKDADNLDFATLNHTPKHRNEGDFCQESIYLDRDKKTGQYVVWRRRNPTIGINPLSGGTREEIARGVLGLRFEYYDGYEWYDTWGDPDGKAQTSRREVPNLTGMPEAVRITLAFDANPDRKTTPGVEESSNTEKEEPPVVFQTVARLNLAGAPARSAGGGSGGDDNSQPGQNPVQMQPPGGGN